MAKPFSTILGPKPKGRPRGKPFQKGERLPYQFKPGQSTPPRHRTVPADWKKKNAGATRSAVRTLVGRYLSMLYS